MAKVQETRNTTYVPASTRSVRFTIKLFVCFAISALLIHWLQNKYELTDGTIALHIAGFLCLFGAEYCYSLHSEIKELEDLIKQRSKETLALANRIGFSFLNSSQKSEVKSFQDECMAAGNRYGAMADALDRLDRVCSHLLGHAPGFEDIESLAHNLADVTKCATK